MKRVLSKVGFIAILLSFTSIAQADYTDLRDKALQIAEQARQVRYSCAHPDQVQSSSADLQQLAQSVVSKSEDLSVEILAAGALKQKDLKNLLSLTDQTLSALEESGCLEA